MKLVLQQKQENLNYQYLKTDQKKALQLGFFFVTYDLYRTTLLQNQNNPSSTEKNISIEGFFNFLALEYYPSFCASADKKDKDYNLFLKQPPDPEDPTILNKNLITSGEIDSQFFTYTTYQKPSNTNNESVKIESIADYSQTSVHAVPEAMKNDKKLVKTQENWIEFRLVSPCELVIQSNLILKMKQGLIIARAEFTVSQLKNQTAEWLVHCPSYNKKDLIDGRSQVLKNQYFICDSKPWVNESPRVNVLRLVKKTIKPVAEEEEKKSADKNLDASLNKKDRDPQMREAEKDCHDLGIKTWDSEEMGLTQRDPCIFMPDFGNSVFNELLYSVSCIQGPHDASTKQDAGYRLLLTLRQIFSFFYDRKAVVVEDLKAKNLTISEDGVLTPIDIKIHKNDNLNQIYRKIKLNLAGRLGTPGHSMPFYLNDLRHNQLLALKDRIYTFVDIQWIGGKKTRAIIKKDLINQDPPDQNTSTTSLDQMQTIEQTVWNEKMRYFFTLYPDITLFFHQNRVSFSSPQDQKKFRFEWDANFPFILFLDYMKYLNSIPRITFRRPGKDYELSTNDLIYWKKKTNPVVLKAPLYGFLLVLFTRILSEKDLKALAQDKIEKNGKIKRFSKLKHFVYQMGHQGQIEQETDFFVRNLLIEKQFIPPYSNMNLIDFFNYLIPMCSPNRLRTEEEEKQYLEFLKKNSNLGIFHPFLYVMHASNYSDKHQKTQPKQTSKSKWTCFFLFILSVIPFFLKGLYFFISLISSLCALLFCSVVSLLNCVPKFSRHRSKWNRWFRKKMTALVVSNNLLLCIILSILFLSISSIWNFIVNMDDLAPILEIAHQYGGELALFFIVSLIYYISEHMKKITDEPLAQENYDAPEKTIHQITNNPQAFQNQQSGFVLESGGAASSAHQSMTSN